MHVPHEIFEIFWGWKKSHCSYQACKNSTRTLFLSKFRFRPVSPFQQRRISLGAIVWSRRGGVAIIRIILIPRNVACPRTYIFGWKITQPFPRSYGGRRLHRGHVEPHIDAFFSTQLYALCTAAGPTMRTCRWDNNENIWHWCYLRNICWCYLKAGIDWRSSTHPGGANVDTGMRDGNGAILQRGLQLWSQVWLVMIITSESEFCEHDSARTLFTDDMRHM